MKNTNKINKEMNTPENNLAKIESEDSYARAIEKLKEMINNGEDIYLLTLVIKDYEDRNVKIDGCDPVEMILYTQDRLGLLDIDMAKKLGMPKGRFSEVMNYKRPLSISLIRNCVAIGMPANVMIKPSINKRNQEQTKRNDIRTKRRRFKAASHTAH